MSESNKVSYTFRYKIGEGNNIVRTEIFTNGSLEWHTYRFHKRIII